LAQPPLPREIYEETARFFIENGKSVIKAAQQAKVNYSTFTSRLRKAREMGIVTEQAATAAKIIDQTTVILQPRFRIQQRKSKPDETKRVLAIGDCHDSPSLSNKNRFFAMGNYAKIKQVDQIIQIGDFATCDSLNSFDKNDTVKGQNKPSFRDDMQSFQEAIRAFHKGLSGYDVPRHVTLGNHEDRIWSYTNKNPEVVDMLDKILFATMDDYGWTYSPYKEFYFVGDVGFTHAPINGMGKAYGGMHCENQISRDALHDVVFGHTHKRLDKAFPKMGGQFLTVINLGCSLPQGHVEEYAKHSLTGWSYGVYDILIKDGRIDQRTWIPINNLIEEYGE